MVLFWWVFAFEKCLGGSSVSYHCPKCLLLSWRIHFLSHVTIRSKKGSFWLCKGKDEETSKCNNFCRSFKSWGTHFSSFLTFPIRSTFPSKIPRTVCDGLVTTRVLKSSSWITAGRSLWGSSSLLKSPELNFVNQRRTVRSLTLSLPNAGLIFQVLLAAL